MARKPVTRPRPGAPSVRGSGVAAAAASAGETGAAPVTAAGIVRADFARIVRVDEARREVELCATSEAVDSYGTVFGYEASKDAFTRWAGNVREMHARKAVGRRVAVRFQDGERRIYARIRISRGAADTWEKILDGTLRGASIGASNVQWRTERRGGREVQVAHRYDLVELSLVDLPSNPDALGIAVIRDGVPLPEQLDPLPDGAEPPDAVEATAATAATGAQPGAAGGEGETGAGGQAAGGAVEAEVEAESAAEAPAVVPAVAAHDDDAAQSWSEIWLAHSALNGGHVMGENGVTGRAEPFASRLATPPSQATHGRDPHQDRAERLAALGAPGYAARTEPPAAGGASPSEAAGAGDASTSGIRDQTAPGDRQDVLHSAARGILLGCGCPDCDAALAALDGDPAETSEAAPPEDARARLVVAAVTRMLAGQTRRLDAALAGLAHVAGTLEQIERRVATIEEQPLPGGPQLRAAEKTHALQPGGAAHVDEQLRALQGLAGRLSDPQAQMAVATEMIRLQQEAAGLTPAMQAMPRAGGRS